MKNNNVDKLIEIKDSVNVFEIEDIDEKDKFSIIFRCGNSSVKIIFSYEDMVAIGCDKSVLKEMLPFLAILNHMIDENLNENESEEN